MRRLPAALAAVLLALGAPALRADTPGAFDYWVLALSWSPSWCAAQGGPDAPQCAPERDLGFVVHGLWPQYEEGWPEWCRSSERDPSRRRTAAMADVMGSGGLAWRQWRKHGRCSGLSAADYFALTRRARAQVRVPAALRALGRPVRIDAAVIEAAFLEANPGLAADGVTVTCRDGRFAEARICFDRALRFRPCAPDAARDCRGMTRLPPPP